VEVVARKNKRKKKGKAVLVYVNRQKIETMSPGILVAVAYWKDNKNS
jgi:hypothetical protein